jgi:TonB-dependent receptor
MQGRFVAALMGSSALFIAGGAHAEAALADAAANEVSGVVITAPREEAIARSRQYDAPNLVNIQAAETILKYPDFNAAEALGRMPGVSISTDTGEGRFVNIRGIDGNLAGATFGGVPMLNTNPGGTYFGGGGRAVEFDTIPTGSIDGLIVYKTTLPDHEAEGLGGSVDLTPRTAADIRRPFAEATLGWGYEPAHDHTGPLNGELAVGGRFGFVGSHLVVEGLGAPQADRAGWMSNPTPFSFVLTASRRDDRRGFDDMEEDYNDPTADRSLADIQMRRYDYHRRRFGFGGEFDFKPNDDHSWYLRANVTGYTESAQKNRLTYAGLGDTVDPANPTGFATTTNISLASTDEEETHRNQVYVVGGVDHFGDTVLDYRASYTRATFNIGQNYNTKFNGPQGLAFTYDNSGNNGDTPTISVNNAIVNDPTQYSPITKITNSTESDVDQEYAYAANLLFPVQFINDSDRVKVGGEVRLRDKSATPSAFTYAISPLSLAAASSAAVTDFYGQYTNGPSINTIAVRDAAAAGTVSGGVDQSGVFTAEENIYAAYAQYQTTIGKWGVLAGVRVEQTDARYGAYSDDNATQTLAFTTRSEDYTNAFPTVQVRYEVQPNLLIRATYSTGIGRPGFLQNSATTSSNHDVTDPQISQGNPNLKPTTGNNFDVSVEYYMDGGGILQVGAFDKEFDNYIVSQFQRRLYDGTDPEFAGMIVGYTTYANRSDAYARGVEAAYHQQFSWLPGLWNGLGVDANVTLVDSHIEEYDAATSATGHAESGLLPGTSKVTGNLAGFYEAHGLQLRLAGEYVSKELFALGGSQAADSIQDNRLTLDFTSSYRLNGNWTVYFSAKNLTNAPLRFYVNNSSFPIQREYYDQTYEAGVRARF